MKKLICTVLSLVLLCCAALPAAAVKDNKITWQEAVQQLKQEETIEELWLPKMAPSFSYSKTSTVVDGSYLYSGFTKMLGRNVWLQIAFVSVNSESPSANMSPYFAMCKQKDEPLSIEDAVWSDWSQGDHVSYTSFEKLSYSYYGSNPFEYKGKTGLYNGWVVGSTPLIGAGMEEIILPVSELYWMVISFVPYGDNTKPEEDKEAFPAALLDQLGLTTTGDADLNGQVNAVDGLLTLKHVVQKAEIADELAFALADWDDDGALDAGDALHTLQKAVGKAR